LQTKGDIIAPLAKNGLPQITQIFTNYYCPICVISEICGNLFCENLCNPWPTFREAE